MEKCLAKLDHKTRKKIQVILPKPLGIGFEEIQAGKGVVVVTVIEGSNAAKSGLVKEGHVLLALTAIKAQTHYV